MNAEYLRALGARMMLPAENGRRDAESAVAGIADAQEAWETLATRDLIPARWIDDPTLCFRPARTAGDKPSKRHPRTVRDCVTLASDVPGVERAMLLLREAWTRLEFVGVRAPPRIFWSCTGRRGVWNSKVVSPDYEREYSDCLSRLITHARARLGLPHLMSEYWEEDAQHEAALGLIEASDVRDLDFGGTLSDMEGGGHGLEDPATFSWMDWYCLADASLTWARAGQEGLTIPNADEKLLDAQREVLTARNAGIRAHYGLAFADVPDPLAPLWQILDLGYLVDLLRPVALDTLIAPARRSNRE